MTKIRWGMLGAANIARTRVLPAMALAPSVELTAVASRTLSAATALCAEFGIERPYGSYEELLADPDIDAVYLPLPNQLHAQWSIRAMEAGKHVLCEKPLCLTPAEIERVREVRDRTGRHIEEAYVYRNHPQWSAVDDVLAAGTIGEVRSAHLTMAMSFLDPNDIRNSPELGGGSLYDMGGYVISACRMIFGREPDRVVAAIDRDPATGVDRLSTAIFDYGGAHAAITVSIRSGPAGRGSHQLLSVLGSTGWLRLDYPLAHAMPTDCHLLIGDDTSYGGVPTSTVTFEPVNQYTLQAERFSRYLLGEPVRCWPIEDALSTLRIIEALFRSAETGGWASMEVAAADPTGAADAEPDDADLPLEHGDRVVAARDIDSTQGIQVLAGTEGTVAEDRGSKLVVFFEEEPKMINVDETDLRRSGD
jgi:predicted dehydrogenase